MTLLYIDIETRSSIDLKKSGVYKYVESPDFGILMACWAVDDGPVQVAYTREQIKAIPGLWDPKVTKVAHNAAFERICFSAWSNRKVGQYLPSREWLDTAVLAAEAGYPRSLRDGAMATGAEAKGEAGPRLIRLFCVPKKDGTFTQPSEKPQEWQEFTQYCKQDVSTMRDIHKRLPNWSTPREEQAYHADQAVNDRGIAVDMDLVHAAVQAAEDNQLELVAKVTEATGIANPNSIVQVISWLNDSGMTIDDLQAETVATWLESNDLTPEQRLVLEARQELALSAAKKYAAAQYMVNSDGRLRMR